MSSLLFTAQIGTHPLLTASPAGYPLIKAAKMLQQKCKFLFTLFVKKTPDNSYWAFFYTLPSHTYLYTIFITSKRTKQRLRTFIKENNYYEIKHGRN